MPSRLPVLASLFLTACLQPPTISLLEDTGPEIPPDLEEMTADVVEDLPQGSEVFVRPRVVTLQPEEAVELALVSPTGEVLDFESRCQVIHPMGAASALVSVAGNQLEAIALVGALFLDVSCDGVKRRIHVSIRPKHWVDAGAGHMCATRPTGELYCWGDNAFGQVGVMAGAAIETPMHIHDETSYRSVSAGPTHTCALSTQNDVTCFGSNLKGQLGLGDVGAMSAPALVDGVKFVKISAGGSHTCGLTEQGELYCAGSNEHGQLGEDLMAVPERRLFGLVNTKKYAAVGAGLEHTCALTMDGDVECAGLGAQGALGGNVSTEVIPSRGRFEKVAANGPFVVLEVGPHNACAMTLEGSWRCWGRNNADQLFDHTLAAESPAPDVPRAPRFDAMASSVEVVTLGFSHTCASSQGRLACYGSNVFAQSGGLRYASEPGIPDISQVLHLASGAFHTCWIGWERGSEVLKCFGDNSRAQLGNGTRGVDKEVMMPVLTGASEVHVSERATCALMSATSKIECWGDGLLSQKGVMSSPFDPSRQEVMNDGGVSGAESLCAGRHHFLGLRSGSVVGWGSGEVFGVSARHSQIQDVSGVSGAAAVACGGNHACVLVSGEDVVQCFGDDNEAQFGARPKPAKGGRATIDSVASPRAVHVGPGTTCIQSEKELLCAGRASTRGLVMTPADPSFTSSFDGRPKNDLVAIGDGFMCLYDEVRGVMCRGRNDLGQIHGQTLDFVETFVPVAGLEDIMRQGTPQALVAGRAHVCLLDKEENVTCWGDNDLGAIRGARFLSHQPPFATYDLEAVSSLSAGGDTTCFVLKSQGDVLCLGENRFGQSRPNRNAMGLTPTPVSPAW